MDKQGNKNVGLWLYPIKKIIRLQEKLELTKGIKHSKYLEVSLEEWIEELENDKEFMKMFYQENIRNSMYL